MPTVDVHTHTPHLLVHMLNKHVTDTGLVKHVSKIGCPLLNGLLRAIGTPVHTQIPQYANNRHTQREERGEERREERRGEERGEERRGEEREML